MSRTTTGHPTPCPPRPRQFHLRTLMVSVAACALISAAVTPLAKIYGPERLAFLAAYSLILLLLFLPFFAPVILMGVVLLVNFVRALKGHEHRDEGGSRP